VKAILPDLDHAKSCCKQQGAEGFFGSAMRFMCLQALQGSWLASASRICTLGD